MSFSSLLFKRIDARVFLRPTDRRVESNLAGRSFLTVPVGNHLGLWWRWFDFCAQLCGDFVSGGARGTHKRWAKTTLNFNLAPLFSLPAFRTLMGNTREIFIVLSAALFTQSSQSIHSPQRKPVKRGSIKIPRPSAFYALIVLCYRHATLNLQEKIPVKEESAIGDYSLFCQVHIQSSRGKCHTAREEGEVSGFEWEMATPCLNIYLWSGGIGISQQSGHFTFYFPCHCTLPPSPDDNSGRKREMKMFANKITHRTSDRWQWQ